MRITVAVITQRTSSRLCTWSTMMLSTVFTSCIVLDVTVARDREGLAVCLRFVDFAVAISREYN
jgi:hypothetical protein